MKTLSIVRGRETVVPGRETAVELRDVRKVHGRGTNAVEALPGVSLALARGTFTVLAILALLSLIVPARWTSRGRPLAALTARE